MFLIDSLDSLLSLIDEIRFGERYGFGSFLWSLAFMLCAFLTYLFFQEEWKALGVIGILGSVVCLFFCYRRMWRDIKKKRTEETR